MGKIEFESIVYFNALTLLTENPNLLKCVLDQMYQSDYELEQISYGLESDELIEKFNTLVDAISVEGLSKYIKVVKSGVSFDYDESAACDDLSCVAFCIPCTFDIDRFINDAINSML